MLPIVDQKLGGKIDGNGSDGGIFFINGSEKNVPIHRSCQCGEYIRGRIFYDVVTNSGNACFIQDTLRTQFGRKILVIEYKQF